MKLIKEMGWGVMALCAGLLVTACASYYRVVEPQSGRAYYTQDVKQERGGAVKFKDAGSGAVVTIQNSEVKEISGKDFDAGLAAAKTKPAPAPTAPAAPAAAAPAAPAPEDTAKTEATPDQSNKSAAPADKGAVPAEESK